MAQKEKRIVVALSKQMRIQDSYFVDTSKSQFYCFCFWGI
jgi:hypothetical protein